MPASLDFHQTECQGYFWLPIALDHAKLAKTPGIDMKVKKGRASMIISYQGKVIRHQICMASNGNTKIIVRSDTLQHAQETIALMLPIYGIERVETEPDKNGLTMTTTIYPWSDELTQREDL